MPLGHALFVASKLAAALDYAHRKHDLSGRAMALVHRDVSPQNVLISFDGEVKLCDFGIAKAASKASHTRAGALKGKLQYMSPEQAWGRDIDHRSDIFSLGLVLYEMATGRKAFAGDSELSILEQVRTPKLVPPRDLEPSIPPQVERLILKALREQREDRYETAGELAAEIDELMQNLRPAPSAPDLGSFLTELVGPAGAGAPPEPKPKAAEPPRPATEEPARAPARVAEPAAAAPVRDEAAHVREVVAPAPVAVPPPSRRPPMTLLAALGVVAIAALVGSLLLTRAKPGEGPAPTPAAEGSDATRQLIAEEVARQQQTAQQQPATDAGDATQPAVQPAPESTRAAAQPTPRPQATQPPAAARPEVAAVPEPVTEPTQAAVEQPTAAPPPTEPSPPEPTRVAAGPAPAAPAPTVRQGDLVDAGEVDTPPEPLSIVKAIYPPLAARQRLGGIVILRALVNENGGVDEVVVLRGIKPDLGLDRAAADALRRWRFKPATKNGVRVKVWHTQSIPFQP
jgi:TonB family protein